MAFDAHKAIEATNRADREAVIAPGPVRKGMVSPPVRWNGYSLGPVTVGHMLGLADLGNELPYALMTGQVRELDLRERVSSDLEVFYAVTLETSEFLRLVRSGEWREQYEAWAGSLPAAFLISGFEKPVLEAIGAGLDTIQLMEAGGSGGGKKLRPLACCLCWLMRWCRAGGIALRRLFASLSPGAGSA